MRHPRRSLILPCLLLVALLAAARRMEAAPAAPAPAAAQPLAFLPDTHVLATVGERKITVYDYRWGYYISDANIRPRPDSLGRVQFLSDLVNKDVLGQAALQSGYEFSFEDRAVFRDFRAQTLSNTLFLRAVNTVPPIPEDSLKRINAYYGRDLRLRLLYFPTREQAEYTRLQLIGGRLTWAAATARFGVRSSNARDGVSDWLKFQALPLEVALQIWPLKVGATSPVILAGSGYHVAQVAEERKGTEMPYVAMRSVIKSGVQGLESTRRRIAIQTEAKQGMDVVYDTTNIVWTASFFRESRRVGTEGLMTTLTVDEHVPEFAPADTARTLVTWRGGRLSVGDIVHAYSGMQPLTRPNINTPDAMAAFVDAIMLGPKMVDFAVRRGLEQDSLVVTALARKREEIMVTHMIEDSVLSRINVSRQERQAYYKEHERDFITFPVVKFAMLVRPTRAAADSTKALLDRGVSIDTLLAADRRANVFGSGTAERQSNDPGDYHKILFEELRPGKSAVVGPDKDKLFGVLHLISYDQGKLVPYEQVEAAIDESVRNIKGDRAIRALIERQEKRFPVKSHPELVMRINLTDPASETMFQ